MGNPEEQYLRQKRESHLAELQEFLRIPSISTLPEHRADMRRCAEWLAQAMEKAGLEHVQVIPTEGHPVVYGEWLHTPNAPTALLYGHYDVQPVDPLDLWTSPPFAAEIRDGKIFARGACDDKGQVFMHLKAVEAMLRTAGTLPVNVKFVIEGEEEVGSPNLLPFIESHRRQIAADVAVVSDTPMLEKGKPALLYALRGFCALQIDVRGANTDLHSGLYGGGVPNAIHALSEILASLRNRSGKIAVQGFYDRVRPLSDEEREATRNIPFNEERLRSELGLFALSGEVGYSYLERTWARPTLEINGVYGGFQGEGSKTVIPCEAHAKITCRLVPDQNPEEIMDLIERHVEQHAPPEVSVKVRRFDRGNPFIAPIDHPYMRAAAKAYEKSYGIPPFFARGGGSIPIIEALSRTLQAPVILMGFALPDERFHAPDEHFHLENFDKGLLTICHYWRELGKISTNKDRDDL